MLIINIISFSLNQDFIWSNWNIIIERVLRLNEVLFKIDRPIFLWNLEYRKRYKKNILYISRYIVFQSLFLIALTYDRVNELVHSHPWLQTFDQAWNHFHLFSNFNLQLRVTTIINSDFEITIVTQWSETRITDQRKNKITFFLDIPFH